MRKGKSGRVPPAYTDKLIISQEGQEAAERAWKRIGTAIRSFAARRQGMIPPEIEASLLELSYEIEAGGPASSWWMNRDEIED